MTAPYGRPKDWEGKADGDGRRGSEYLSQCIGFVDNVLTCVVMCVSEDGMVPLSGASLLHHYSWPDVVGRGGSLIPISRNSVYSPVVKWEDRFW